LETEDSAGSGDRPRLLHVSVEHGGNEETDRLHRRAKSALSFYSFNSLIFLQFSQLYSFIFVLKKMYRRAKSVFSFFSFHSSIFLQLYSFKAF